MVLLVGKDAYKSKLASTFQALAHDTSPKIRRTIACGFHEVCAPVPLRRGGSRDIFVLKVVGALEDKAALVAGTYQAMLKDHSEEVRYNYLALFKLLSFFLAGIDRPSNTPPHCSQVLCQSLQPCPRNTSKLAQFS